MGVKLRDYQVAVTHAVIDGIEDGENRLLYVLPCGTGKTTCFAELCRIFVTYYGWNVLVLAHRRELIIQARNRIADHCNFTDREISIEMADAHFYDTSSVVVGSIDTVRGVKRLEGWKPDVIITDECHRSPSDSFKKVFDRFGVRDKKCVLLGCTATPKRTDKKSLYALKPDGSPVMLKDGKTKKVFQATEDDSVFQRMCYEMSLPAGVDAGWLVPIRGVVSETHYDLRGLKSHKTADGENDFSQQELNKRLTDKSEEKRVENARRTNVAINDWKKCAEGRQTVVFCAGVEHAQDSAELWRQAGYTAQAVWGDMDKYERREYTEDFKAGRLQVLCNCDVFTEGTDLPTCSCIVHLAPTKSWGRYMQRTGRGGRPHPSVSEKLNDLPTPDDRRALIAGSVKSDCIVIDLVDIIEHHDIQKAPAIYDLPVNLNLEGHTLSEAETTTREFDEIKEELGLSTECPVRFSELQSIVREVQLLRQVNPNIRGAWGVSAVGFHFNKSRPGYSAELRRADDKSFTLVVRKGKEVLHAQRGKEGVSLTDYLDRAAQKSREVIDDHALSVQMPVAHRLTDGQYNALRRNKYSHEAINTMTYGYAKKLAGQLSKAYYERKRQES